MNIGLIDLDIVVYKVASACENTFWIYKGRKWESKVELNIVLKEDGVDKDKQDAVVTKDCEPETWDDCKESLVSYTEGILDKYDNYKGFLSGKGNFRYKFATILPYKGNRSKLSKPFHYDSCRQFLVDAYAATISSGIEADDAIGLEAIEGTVIVSNDKDLDCIPGDHYNWDKDEDYTVSPIESYRNFFKQMFTGDTTDNILGLYGVGPKAAMVTKINKMDTIDEMKELVEFEYGRRFGSYAPQFIQENAKLLWILQQRENPLVPERYWGV